MIVVYTKTALKQLRHINPSIASVIRGKIAQYADDPQSLANQIKKLKGSHFLRLRVGDYRVIFSADGTIVTIVKIGHRREIYD